MIANLEEQNTKKLYNMIDNEIIGGISPLKKRRSKKAILKKGAKRDIAGKKAGKHGQVNTRSKRRRGGFSEAGAAGVNAHGYGRATRFKYNKAAAGPLAPATSSKTGPSGGGGGPNPYPIDSGDTIYNTTSTDNSINDNRQDNSSTNIETGDVNEGDNTIKSNNKNISKQDNKSNQEIESETKTGGGFAEACRPNGERLPSGSIGTDSKGKRFKCVWDPNYKPRAKSKNKQRSKNTNNNKQVIENPQSIDNSGRTNDTSVTYTKKSILDAPSIVKYDPTKRSPSKMKSHAWDMLQKMKKARGGTQKYK